MLNAKKNFHQASSLLLISRGGRLAGAIGLILVGLRDPILFTLARWIATLIAMLIAMFITRPAFTLNKPGYYYGMIKSSLAFGLSDFLSAIYIQADISILALIKGNRDLIGAYSPATGLISALFIIPNAVYLVILPNIIKAINERDRKLRGIYRNSFLGFTGLGLILMVSIWLIGKPVTLFILGPAYKTTGDLMIILSPIIFMKSIEFVCADFIIAGGLQKSRLMPQVLSALLNVILNIILIPLWGVWAVAYVYVLSELVLVIGYLWIVFRKWQELKMEPNITWMNH